MRIVAFWEVRKPSGVVSTVLLVDLVICIQRGRFYGHGLNTVLSYRQDGVTWTVVRLEVQSPSLLTLLDESLEYPSTIGSGEFLQYGPSLPR